MAGHLSTRRRALFDLAPRLVDLVPFTPLADGLPTPVEELEPGLTVQRDDLTSTLYGGNKVRKFEFTLPIAVRRGGPVVTAGGIGSHHVLAVACHGERLGLEVHAVQYPQRETDDVERTAGELATHDVHVSEVGSPYAMPFGLARALASVATRNPMFLWPGASTPLGTLGHVSAGLELVDAHTEAGLAAPDDVVVACGSGGTAVGLALGVALGGWTRARVVAVRVADAIVTNRVVLGGLEAGSRALLALGGLRPPRTRLDIDTAWFGDGYGHPSRAGDAATQVAGALGLPLEPTYTAKAFAAALARHRMGRRVLYIHTFAGGSMDQR